MRRLLWPLACLLVASACSRQPAATIAVIPKNDSRVFWRHIHGGAEKAAKELGLQVAWRVPSPENDRDAQIAEVERAVAAGATGIVLAPLDESALAPAVAAAAKRGVPVVILDSTLKGDDYVSFVATDNNVVGRLAGEELARVMHGTGRVAVLRYAEGQDSTTRREESFLAAMRQHPDISIVSADQYAGMDGEAAYRKAAALLERLTSADGTPQLDGIFCPNESTTLGVLRALHDNGWDGKVRFVGFDASDTVVQGVRDGKVDGLVVQDPVRMGYVAVTTLAAHARGQKVERRIDTGARLITRNILDQPDIKELLNPDLTKWLKP